GGVGAAGANVTFVAPADGRRDCTTTAPVPAATTATTHSAAAALPCATAKNFVTAPRIVPAPPLVAEESAAAVTTGASDAGAAWASCRDSPCTTSAAESIAMP